MDPLVSGPVLRRLLLLPAAALVLVLSTGCAADVAPAVTIDGDKVSDKDFLDEVSQWAHNPAAYPAERLAEHNPGTYPMQLVSAILGQRIDLALSHDEFVRQGLEVTDEIRQQAVALLFQGDMQTAEQALAGFSAEYREQYVEEISEQLALQDELGEAGYSEWRDRAYLESDVEISPRYGTWDGTNGSVTPPEGPTQPAGADDFPVS
jgi:hypothetical protein